jgi:hypothetical protein
MKPVNLRIAAPLSLLLAFCFAGASYGQSVADLARKERTRKAQQPRTGKQYTNDNIPATTIGGPAATTPSAQPTPAAEAEAEEEAAAGAEETKPPAEAGPSQADLEKAYRERAAKLRETLEFEERKLDVMQRELNLAQQQFYSDPNVAMREQYSRADINKRTADIETQQALVEKAKQAFTDLEEELRHKNLPPGWAR